MPDIRVVCFDLGGVIVRHCRSWAEGITAAGLDVRGATDCPEASARRKELTRLHTLGALEDAEFFAQMAATTGGAYSPAEVEQIHRCWTQEEYAGVRAVVESLLERYRSDASDPADDNCRLGVGILSNTNAPHWRLLSDALRYPTVGLLRSAAAGALAQASHLLRLAKPAPAVYAEYQRLAGVNPSQILFLEDLPDNIAAARAAGWRVEPIDHTRETAGQIEGALRRHGVL